MAAERLGSLAGRSILVLGAGDMGEGMVRSLVSGGVVDVRIANRTWDRAVELDDGKNRIAWRLRRALTLARLGEHARAAAEADALASGTPVGGNLLYNAACVYACAAAAVRAGVGRPEADPPRLAPTAARSRA